MKNCFLLFSLFLLAAAISVGQPLQEGLWQAQFERQDGIKIPFQLKISYPDNNEKPNIALYNEAEILEAEKVTFADDSVLVSLAYFFTELRFKILSSNAIQGFWVDKSRDSTFLAFSAQPLTQNISSDSLSGKWASTFRPGAPNSYQALAFIENAQQGLKATFRTSSGDYRFLSGNLIQDSLSLYRFDGQVIYLFTAKVLGDSLIQGKMYSGPKSITEWQAVKDVNAELTDSYERTKLVSMQPLDFKVKNLQNDEVHIDPSKLRDKVSIITIGGTWCPNCLDEARFLKKFINEHPDLPIQVFAINFERPKDWTQIKTLLDKYSAALQLPYSFHYAGSPNAESVLKIFPMLDGMRAWPTMLVVDKNAQIRKIHTGFDGPAAKEEHEKFALQFKELIQMLSAEKF